MRSLAGYYGMAVAAMLMNSTSAAHPAQWCALYRTGGTNCGFTTFAQCQATISGVGGMCNQGPDQDAQPAKREKALSKQKSETAVRRPVRPAVTTTPAAAAATTAPATIAAQPKPGEFAAARKLILDGQYQAGVTAMGALGSDNNPDVASYIGLALRKLGRIDEAKSWYERALTADPNHKLTLSFYGMLRAEQGDLAGARVDLAKIG